MVINIEKLSNEQREFAAENHYLVENFLKFRHLDRSEYYGIVAMGYIRAVRNYFNRTDLQQYRFSTIAVYTMKSDLFNYYRKNSRKKRTANVISLEAPAFDVGVLTIAETVTAPGSVSDYIDFEILRNNITANLSDVCTKVLRMKSEGYSNREIAKIHGISLKNVTNMLTEIQTSVEDMRLV
jgi:RNA polymerase sigma-70 factor (ECF subfamily)